LDSVLPLSIAGLFRQTSHFSYPATLVSDTFEDRSAKGRYFQGFHKISRC
jgi:hypothetical protein